MLEAKWKRDRRVVSLLLFNVGVGVICEKFSFLCLVVKEEGFWWITVSFWSEQVLLI